MKIVMSSGHGAKISGAVDIINEHDEAVRVVDRTAEHLRRAGVECITYEDTVSDDQDENLKRIVDYHNNSCGPHDWDISVHFNCSNGTTSKPIGTEVFHYSNEEMAAKVSQAIADAGDFVDRGAKDGSGLYFCRNTAEKSLLLEVCFVNSQADCDLYEQNFDLICAAIAGAIAEEEIEAAPPKPSKPTPKPPKPDEDKPVLGLGDKDKEFDQPYVSDLQRQLNAENSAGLNVDGDFGGATDSAVRSYQYSRALDVDGVVGEQTWDALAEHTPPVIKPPPPALTQEQQDQICGMAYAQPIADYEWDDRGVAPKGWIQGAALSFAQTYRKLLADHPAAVEMAKARTDSDKDALNIYRSEFDKLGMSNENSGPDTLRHLYALMIGHAMRESNGQHCEGRDLSADNVSSDTAEAGLFQTSYNAHSASAPHFDNLMREYSDPNNETCYFDAFIDDVECDDDDWDCYGSGEGYAFQKLCKDCPPFACETAALTLRKLANHYGPIIREEVELKKEADAMLRMVQTYVDALEGNVSV